MVDEGICDPMKYDRSGLNLWHVPWGVGTSAVGRPGLGPLESVHEGVARML